MKTIISILLCFISFLHEAKTQELLYDININGRKVGSLLVTKTQIDESTVYYSAVSDVQYTLFKKTELLYLYEAVFENSLLKKSYFVYKKNGEIEEEAKLLWSKDGTYLSNIESFHKKQDAQLAKSMVQMYYEKPMHKDSIFSERFHDFVTIAEVPEEHKFICYIPNGDKSVYHYNDNGYCHKININTTFLSFEMVLQYPLDKD